LWKHLKFEARLFFTFKTLIMAFNLMEMVKNYFTADFTNHASSALGENSSGISKALSAIIPTSLAGILKKSTSGTTGANDVFEMAKSSVNEVSTAPNVPLTVSEEKGSTMLSRLFDGNQAAIVGAISQFAGIKDSSGSSLMSMALPPIMGLLGRHAEQNNLSASGLAGFLSSQKDHIMQAMPAGLTSLAGMLGLSSLEGAASHLKNTDLKNTSHSAIDDVKTISERPTAKWLVPLIVILIVVAGLWYFSRSCNETKPSTAAVTDTTATARNNDTGTAMRTTPPDTTAGSMKVQLPNGKELEANKGGIEDQLVTFLNSNWKSLSDDSLKNKWFNFDNLNFNLGTATITPASEKQLDNIAEILKAYPDAKIKIGGYTDASGNAADNKKLSQDRANAAKAALDKRGVGSQLIGAEGYGSQYAEYPASAPDDQRALDRHVSVSLRK
jgi:outer membrane protein OmpA-like peptidoglycan-associated protein